MIGAIIGDIVGSRFENHNHKSKDFEFFSKDCRFTDDTVMTCAIAKAVLESRIHRRLLGEKAIECMQSLGRKHPNCGYGQSFHSWIFSKNPLPYNSWGNGSAMRVSPVSYAAKSLDECKAMSKDVTAVTHNHLEGIKGAEAVAVAIWMALNRETKRSICLEIHQHYYPLDFSIDKIRDSYSFDVSCQGSVPQAIEAFLESTDFEDAIRLAVSIGGDSDTIAAITGGIAGAYYGVPSEFRERVMEYLTDDLRDILIEFEEAYG